VHPEILELLNVEPGTEVLSCDTIESTQGSVGDETWWYPSLTFFTRNLHDGTTAVVADLPPNSNEVEQAIAPVPTKVLLHPFRPADGGPEFDEEVFEQVLVDLAKDSRKYGKLTAVRSVLSGLGKQEIINSESYPDKQELLEKLRKSWKARPICASVAIKCWQSYLLESAENEEEGVDRILEYMPHWSHKSTPSSMVKHLTEHGWAVLDTFDA